MKRPITKDCGIKRATKEDLSAWLLMRGKLWPRCSDVRHRDEVRRTLRNPNRLAAFLSFLEGRPVGLLEMSIREEVDGCINSPAAFIEGWFVEEQERRKGIGSRLLWAAEQWAISKKCHEIGSDSEVGNVVAILSHQSCGYTQIETVVKFVKTIQNCNGMSACINSKNRE